MKQQFIVIISVITSSILVLYFCSQNIAANNNNTLLYKRTAIQKPDSIFSIYKIDSINSYYLIYAKMNDTLYKIVSRKIENSYCDKIELNKDYFLSLNSIWRKEMLIDGINVSPSVTPHVNCLHFNDSTAICLERDSINDLYEAKNLLGLCIKNNLNSAVSSKTKQR